MHWAAVNCQFSKKKKKEKIPHFFALWNIFNFQVLLVIVFYVSFLDSDYSFAFNLAKTDEVYQHARDPMGQSATSYLHDMQHYKYKNLNAYRLLDPRDTYPTYPGNVQSFKITADIMICHIVY